MIRDELIRNPAAELKQLQTLVLDECSIQVSLSSISRRLKALGCSPSQNAGQTKRARKRSEDVNNGVSSLLDNRSSESLNPQQHDVSEFEHLPDLDDYENIHRAFGTDADLSAYGGSPGMGLDMLEMQDNYGNLGDTLGVSHDDSQLYKYGSFEKNTQLHEYSPGLNQSLYQHAEHQRQMLFNDPNLSVGSEWQEV